MNDLNANETRIASKDTVVHDAIGGMDADEEPIVHKSGVEFVEVLVDAQTVDMVQKQSAAFDYEGYDGERISTDGVDVPSTVIEAAGMNNDDELAVGWIELLDPSSGRPYYYNEVKGITSWDRPPLTTDIPLDIDVGLVGDVSLSHNSLNVFRPRPGHAIASFGFGGRLCVMIPQTADKLNIGPGSLVTHINVPSLRRGPVNIWNTHALLRESFANFNHFRPFIFSDDSEVLSFLACKAKDGNTDSEMLWKLILIAANFKGRLRSSSGSSTVTVTPESAIVNILIPDKDTGRILFGGIVPSHGAYVLLI
jgi:hypothetical protein